MSISYKWCPATILLKHIISFGPVPKKKDNGYFYVKALNDLLFVSNQVTSYFFIGFSYRPLILNKKLILLSLSR
jgi:hypothetical protein